MKDCIKEVLVTSEEIQNKVKELAEKINCDYKNKNLVVVGVLKGAAVFMSDLIKNIDVPLTIDFIAVSSYGSSTESSGVVKLIKDLEESIEGKDVLIVEDIIDTGLTLSYLVENLKSRGPNSVRICSLLDKPERRKVDVKVDYVGFKIPDKFVVGYGIDFAEKYRNSSYVAVVKEECYS